MENDQVIQPYMVCYAFDSLVNKLSQYQRPETPAAMPREPYPLFVTWKITKNGQYVSGELAIILTYQIPIVAYVGVSAVLMISS